MPLVAVSSTSVVAFAWHDTKQESGDLSKNHAPPQNKTDGSEIF